MVSKRIYLNNLRNFCKSIVCDLQKGDLLFFEGEMGSGKTTLIREVLNSIFENYKLEFQFQGSPSYQRENRYLLKDLEIVHYDFFLINNPNFDLEQEISNKILFVEWPSKKMKIEYQNESTIVKLISESDYKKINIEGKYSDWMKLL